MSEYKRGDAVLVRFGRGTQVAIYWRTAGEIAHEVFRYSGTKHTFGVNPSRIHDSLLVGSADGDSECRDLAVREAWRRFQPEKDLTCTIVTSGTCVCQNDPGMHDRSKVLLRG